MTDGVDRTGGIARAVARDGWWGLYDTQTDTWLGQAEGPVTYEDNEIAQVAAAIVETQLRWEIGRLRAKVYQAGVIVKRDEINTHMTGLDALRRLEGFSDGTE